MEVRSDLLPTNIKGMSSEPEIERPEIVKGDVRFESINQADKKFAFCLISFIVMSFHNELTFHLNNLFPNAFHFFQRGDIIQGKDENEGMAEANVQLSHCWESVYSGRIHDLK